MGYDVTHYEADGPQSQDGPTPSEKYQKSCEKNPNGVQQKLTYMTMVLSAGFLAAQLRLTARKNLGETRHEKPAG